MSRDDIDFWKNIVAVGFKGAGVILFTILGFLATKAYGTFEDKMIHIENQVKETNDKMDGELKEINRTIQQLDRKVENLEMYNKFEEKYNKK